MSMYNYKATLARIVDGDTFDLDVDLGFKIKARIRVRLLGVDAPESFGVKKDTEEYKKGKRTIDFVTDWFSDAEALEVQTHKTEKYGRWLGVITKETLPANPDNVSIRDIVSSYDAMTLNEALKTWLENGGK